MRRGGGTFQVRSLLIAEHSNCGTIICETFQVRNVPIAEPSKLASGAGGLVWVVDEYRNHNTSENGAPFSASLLVWVGLFVQ